AFVAAGAQVTSSQTIRISAGDDVYHMGLAGASSLGLAAVGAAANLTLVNNTTQAYVAGHADAAKNVVIRAIGLEDILAMATAESGSIGIGVTASLPVISLETHTHAFVDSNAFVHATGNVLVYARDDTKTSDISGQIGLGIGLGVGASASVTLITKDTRAYVGAGATVNADGSTGDTISAFDGSVPATGASPRHPITELGV